MKQLLTLIVFPSALLVSLGRAEGQGLSELLKSQAERWDKAFVAKDLRGIEENLAESFRQIDGDGDISDRKAFVADLMSPDLKIDPYSVEDFDVRIYGDVALLSGRTKMTGSYKGKPFASHYRYVDTYHLENGLWRVVHIQITRMPKL